ncbi:MAG: mechanosensitive ion channel [Phycisphaerae bacterium]|nr:mechanosensitive ion channel [Phycisphaerae bacterium]
MFGIGLKTLKSTYLAVLCVSLCLWGLFACSASAQSTPQAPANTPTTAPSVPQPLPQGDTPLTLDAITGLKTQTASSDQIDEPTKAKLQELYDQILLHLKQLKENQDSRLSYDQYRTNAPADLEKIKAALAQPANPLSDLPGSEASLEQIQQALTEANLGLEKAKATADDREQEPKRRTERRTQIPERMTTHQKIIADMDEQLRTQAKTTPLDQAKDLLAQAKKQASAARIDMITAEMLYFDATTDLLAAQRDQATRQLDTAKKRVAALQDRLNLQRKAEAEKIRQQAAQATKQTEQDHPVVQKVALKNTELAQKQKDLTDLLQKTTERDQKIKQQVVRLGEDMDAAKERLNMAHGVTHVTRTLLRSERNKLNKLYNVQANRRAIKERVSEITDTQLDIYQYDQDWTQLGDTELVISTRLANSEQPIPEGQREAIVTKLTDLLQNQRTIVRRIADLSQSYSTALLSLDISERQLVDELHKYQAFIDENVLWVRIGSWSDFMSVHAFWSALVWLVSPAQWHEVATLLRSDLAAQPESYAGVFLGLILGLLLHRRIIHHIRQLTEKTRHTYTDRFLHTLVVIALTILLSLIWAGSIRFIGWRLDLSTSNSEFVRVMSGALSVLSFQVFVLLFFYWLLLPDGLALQLGLNDRSRAFFRRHLVWFVMVSLPLTFAGYLLQEQQLNETWAGGIGRLLLVLNLCAFTGLAYVLLHPTNPIITPFLEKHKNNWVGRVHPMWRGLVTLVPAGFTVLALFGYAYAARHLYLKLLAVALLAVGCGLAYALLIRWLEITEKQSIFRLRRKRQRDAGTDSKESSLLDDPHPEQAIQSISDQTRRLIHALAVLILIIGIWWIFQSILPAMNKIQEHGLWPTANLDANQEPIDITIGNLVGAFLFVVMTVIVTKNVPGLLEITLLRNLPLDRGARFAISTLCRYALAIIGITLAFTKIGIGWAKVQWLVAAMTVGLGFGLQEIFANFISGLIILFEQPIRVDDVVTVEDVTGVVTQIKIRATTIRKWDRRELIVPNKEFITNRLINWTLSDNVMRMEFPVGIAYGSDTAKAEKLLYEIAQADTDVLKDPPAVVIFKGFGDSCLDFELRVYFNGIDAYLPLWHRINMAIDQAFRQANVEIAFPQRDLHLRSSDIPLPFKTE